MTQRPAFADLTRDQQRQFGNGVGPFWLSEGIRTLITDTASWFFDDASWRHHDFGYAVGGDRWDRARCDWKFFTAMLNDAWSQDHGDGCPFCKALLNAFAVPTAVITSVIFYLAVRLGGQWGSFRYSDSYATLDDLKAAADL